MLLLLIIAFSVIWFLSTRFVSFLAGVALIATGCFILNFIGLFFFTLVVSILLFIHPDK